MSFYYVLDLFSDLSIFIMATYIIEEKVLIVTSMECLEEMFKRVFLQFFPEDLYPLKVLSVVQAFKSTGCVKFAHNKKIQPCIVPFRQ